MPGRCDAVRKARLYALLWLLCMGLLSACGDGAWNNPYPLADRQQNVLYASFSERPKHLDPVQAYSASEYVFIANIYEPPLQYHYLKRPYTLEPLTVEAMPEPRYLDKAGGVLPANAAAEQIAFTEYDLRVRPGIHYQPHPAFATDASGAYRYQQLSPALLEKIYTLGDFAHTGSRELVAADYVYQIKRLAHPRVHSPILGLMSDYIVGLGDYAATLKAADAALTASHAGDERPYLDLTQYPLEGAKVIDRYTYRITVKGKYPQMVYWLAMPFFAPMPPEADRFYQQPGLAERNISLDWYPVGTGAYMLTVNNPNLRMVLERNPNFHEEFYPSEGEASDAAAGLLADAGKALPLIDRVDFNLEKETIPYWNKFLQGYYDASGISSDSFDQAVKIDMQGEVGLTESMQEKGIQLKTAVASSIFYMGFNMLDPVIGGLDERGRKLRRAISIAVDYEEYISIFLNGRGIAAQSPLPAAIFGHEEGKGGINPYVYTWENGQPQRRSIDEAKRLLAEAGYPGGRDAISGRPLLLNLDTTGGGPDDKARMDWLRKQFAKIDLELVIRDTDYNRFQEKMRKGTAQLFQWGWNADYPDPENFFFLLNGPNGKVEHGGENAANYANPAFDKLFERMKNMENGPERMALIQDMLSIVRADAPWLWGFHPKEFSLHHGWYYNSKPHLMANNTLKYKRIDPVLRAEMRALWNRPVLWPLWGMLLLLVLVILPAAYTYWRREHVAPGLAPIAGGGER